MSECRTILVPSVCLGCGQLWNPAPESESELCEACEAAQYGGNEKHERARLFEPAPNQIPGQLPLG